MDYVVGINIQRVEDRSYVFLHQSIIDVIISYVDLADSKLTKPVLVKVSL